jgi:hypothetical protein
MVPVPLQRCGVVLLGLALLGGVCAAADPKPPKMRFASETRADAQKWQEEARKTVIELLKMADLQATRAPGGEAIPFAAKELRSEDRGKYVWSEREIQSTKTRPIKVVVTIPKDSKPGEKFPAVVCIHGHGGDRYIVYDRKGI